MLELKLNNGRWINKTFRLLEKEIELIRKEVKIVRSNSSDVFKIRSLLSLAKESNGFQKDYFEYQKEWIIEQIKENNLPEDSSGSFVSALLDIDTILVYFDIEENEDLKSYVSKELKKIKNNC